MDLAWSASAKSDLIRIHDFLALKNERAATETVRSLIAAPERLLRHPRSGKQLQEFLPRDVRRIFVGPFEMRYEQTRQRIFILRIWHGREERVAGD